MSGLGRLYREPVRRRPSPREICEMCQAIRERAREVVKQTRDLERHRAARN
jgi:hypothetical protein